jgi:hypothetical protein
MPAPSHTWFHAMAAVPAARLSVIRGVFVRSVLKRGGKCAPDRTPSAPPAPADIPGPIRMRAMPFRCCAKGSHGRAGRLCLVRKARRPCCSACRCNHGEHEGPRRATKVCRTCRPGEPVGDARAFQALRAQRHHEAGRHCLDLAAVPRCANARTGRAWFQSIRAVSINR